MITTITRIETNHRAFGGSSAASGEEQLARAARAATNAPSGLAHAEFMSDMGPQETRQLFELFEVQRWNRPWLQRVLNSGINGNAAELTVTTRAVFEVLARHGSDAIRLDGFSSHVNGMHLAMVLRATADELENTDAWKKALAIARTALEDAGIDPDVALYGLTQAE